MFIRPCYRKKDGRRHAYWALVESYRTERGPRQRTVAYLGQLDEAGRLGVKRAAKGNKDSAGEQLQFWEGDSPAPEWVEVNTAAIRVENQLAFGGPWLAQQIFCKLQLEDFLGRTIPQGKEDLSWSLMAQVLVICRLCNPSSELHVAEHYYRSTAMNELLGVPIGYEVFEGNRTDVTTLKEIVETMEGRYGKADRIWVGDRGMMSKKNVEFLKSGDRRYIIGAAKASLRQFERELLAEDWRQIREGLEVKLCPSPGKRNKPGGTGPRSAKAATCFAAM